VGVKWLILISLLALLVFALGARFGNSRRVDAVAFVPVRDLADDVRVSIERDLASGLKVRAIKTYRRATGAGLVPAKTAVDVHERKLDGGAA
jgi:ribosomal protein L7/L12